MTFTGASSPVTLNSSTGTDVTFTAGGIVSLSATGTNITITATEVDGSVTNEGSLTVLAGGANTSVISSNTSGSTDVTLSVAGIISISETGNTITLTGTEVDGSVTNEGSLTVGAGGANTSTISSNTSGSTDVTISGGSGITVTEVGNTITIAATATGTDLTFSGASSPVTLNSSTGTDVTFTAGGILSFSATSGNITMTATEVDGSVTNEGSLSVGAGGANTSTINSNTSGSGVVTISGGTNVTVTESGNTITIASSASGITGAENGLSLSGSNVRLGGTLLTNTQINMADLLMTWNQGTHNYSRYNFTMATPKATQTWQGRASRATNSTATEDAVLNIQGRTVGGTFINSMMSIGIDTVDTEGGWIQVRNPSTYATQRPLMLQPRGGQMAVGRLNNLSALVTFTGTGLSGSTAAGSVLLLENSEGNGKTSLGFGSGSNNLTGEMAMFHATDALRIINRNTTTGTSSIRFAVGGETTDRMTLIGSSASSNARLGVGVTNPASLHSTLQSAGSLATAYLETVGAPTFDETKRTVIYTASTNVSWTLPSAATCGCEGREYILHHAGTAGTITLSQSISKGNGTNFNTLTAGQWAYIIYGASSIRGYKITSL